MQFNKVADMLATIIERAKAGGKIEGVVSHLVDGGLYILQYANDMILFVKYDLEKVRDLKLILPPFEQLSGLKNNFHKSESSPKTRQVYMPSFLDVDWPVAN
jgi:hypothetical protein